MTENTGVCERCGSEIIPMYGLGEDMQHVMIDYECNCPPTDVILVRPERKATNDRP